MSLFSMALFGSRARGDGDPKSDVDILLITEDEKPRVVSTNRMSFSFYPATWLLEKAVEGDLFVLHLVKEGIVIHDERGDFARMSEAFQLRKSYLRHVEHASALGRFLVRYGAHIENGLLLNRRVAWCVRTILISRSAEAGAPVFSAKSLSLFAGSNVVEMLIKRKDDIDLDAAAMRSFGSFLDRWGESHANERWRKQQFADHFRITGNDLALRTFFEGFDGVGAEYS